MKLAAVSIIILTGLAVFVAWTILIMVVGPGTEEDSPRWLCQLRGTQICN